MSTAGSPAWPVSSVTMRKDGTVAVEWSDADITDDILAEFVTKRLPVLLESLPGDRKSKSLECSVNLSGNQLQQPDPVSLLLRRLREAKVHVTVLRLHKNRLSDSIVATLAEHIIASANQPLMQLHLSNNSLSEVGIRQLIEAAHQSKAYPRREPSGPLMSLGVADCKRRALWLRTEMQRPALADPTKLVQQLAADGYTVCITTSREQEVPPDAVVQMPPVFLQTSSEGKGKGKELEGMEPKGKGKAKGSEGGKARSFGPKGKGKAANGTHEFAGQSSRKGELVDEMSSALAWLKEQRDRGGPDSEFEAAWKAWCAEHQLTRLPKAMRMQSVLDFRQNREGRATEAPAQAPRTSPSQVSSRPHTPAAKPSASQLPVAEPAVSEPPGSTTTEPAVAGPAVTESEPVQPSAAKLLASANSVTEPASVQPLPAAPLAAEPKTPAGGNTTAFANTSTVHWLTRAAATVSLKLHRVQTLGVLQDALVPNREPGSEWQRLAYMGSQALERGCSARAFQMAGSLLDDDGLAELSRACSSRTGLANAYRMLGLSSLVKNSDDDADDRNCSGVLSAIFGELEDSHRGFHAEEKSAIEAAVQSMLEFVFLFGSVGFFGGIHTDQSSPSTQEAPLADQASTREDAASEPSAVAVLSSASPGSDTPEEDLAVAPVDSALPDLDSILAAFGLAGPAELDAQEEANADSMQTATCGAVQVTDEWSDGPPAADADSCHGEEMERQRRVDARSKRGEVRWNYSGLTQEERRQAQSSEQVERTSGGLADYAVVESNEQAMLRMIGDRLPKHQQGVKSEASLGGQSRKGGKSDKGGKGGKSAPAPAADLGEKNYKRHLCKYFEQKGWCSNGAQCTFAHGASELASSGTAPHRGPSWEAGPSRHRS